MKSNIKALTNLLSDIQNGDLKYIFPRFANYLAAYFKLSSFVPQPLEIQIEPSSVCNLKCRMCNLDKSSDPNHFLTVENFNFLLKSLKHLRSINFTGMGESLLNPNFPSLIKIARDHDISVYFVTNGQLLNKPIVNKLLPLDLKAIIFSMESGIPKYYEKNRPGAKFSLLEKNISYLSQQIKIHKSNTQIFINVVLLPFNLNNLSHIFKIIDFANKYNIKNISFQFTHKIDNFHLNKYFRHGSSLLKSKFLHISDYATTNKIMVILPQTSIKTGSCYYPWVYPQITSSGHLLPCCLIPWFDHYSKIINNYSWGNVFTTPFDQVWNNSNARAFRRRLKNHPNPFCSHCSKYLGFL